MDILCALLINNRAEGNLVHSLSSSNPSRLLLTAIQRELPISAPVDAMALDAVTKAKETEFYLGSVQDQQGGQSQVRHFVLYAFGCSIVCYLRRFDGCIVSSQATHPEAR